MRIYGENDTINQLIENSMEKIKGLINSSTIVGEKIETSDGTTIIPISRVSVGYVVGGGEYADLSSKKAHNNFPMAGGSSGGMSISPIGFLVETAGEVSFITVEDKSMYQTVLNAVNAILKKMNKRSGDEK